MKQPAFAFVNVIAWAWLAVSVLRWLERLSAIMGASLRNTLGF
jgi:hypothetical protein